LAAILACPAQDDVVRGDGVAASVRDTLDRRLEACVLERLDLATVVTHEVVMVIAACVRRLEACDAVTEIDPLHESERVHSVERPVDARDPDAAAARTHSVVDLLRREAAVLLTEELDDQPTRAAAPAGRTAQFPKGGVHPRLWHGDNDTRSQERATVLAVRALAVLAAAVTLAGCASTDSAEESSPGEPPVVVASFYPLAWAADRVSRTSTEVVNLTPPGVEPHDIELAPSDVETIHDAGLVVYVGGGFQPAVEDAVASREGRSLDVLDGESDPHIWLDPVRFAQVVERIARAVGAAGSGQRVVRELEVLDAEYRRGLANCKSRVLVTTHAAFGRLAARYGLTQLALAGRTPESEPSPRDLERLIADVRVSGATTVFAEPLVSSRVAETVARESGARVATLDPIEGLSQKRLDAGEDYVSVMRSNLAALQQALGCRQL
jgi:zinc transport system substrate-binding protein